MATNNHDKPGSENAVSMDTEDLFDKIYRDELDALEDDQHEKPAAKTGTKTSKGLKKKVVYRPKVEASKKVAPKTEATKRKVIKKKPTSTANRDAHEEISSKKVVKRDEVGMDETESQPKIGGGSDKIKIALLCVILVAAVAFIINALGIVNFGGLLGLSEPTKKEEIRPRVARKPPAKTIQKAPGGATKPLPKKTSNQAPSKPLVQKKTLVVKKLPQAAPPLGQPQTVINNTQPTSPAKEPVVTQQRYRRATPAKKPPAVQQPPKPPAPDPRPVVVMKPSQPKTSIPTPVMAKEPPTPATSAPAPVVARKPPEAPISKATPAVVQQTPKPATHTQKKGVSGKVQLPRKGRINAYPYSVYLGSYPSRERADKAISGYLKKDLSPYWVKVDLGDKGVWYRVFAGHYENSDEAEAIIKEKGLADAQVQKTEHAAPTSAFLKKDKSTKKKEFKEEERPPKSTALSYPYSVYLGSYRTLDHAKKAISSYEKRGLFPYWVKLDLGDKGVWFRLFTGYFQKREQANEFIEEKNIEEAESRHTKYTNLIGVFNSQEERDKEKIRLSNLELSPYVIPGPNGQSRLYVGAFYQRRRAEKQQAELASQGIQSQVVER
jgi:cell division septation protein DedD